MSNTPEPCGCKIQWAYSDTHPPIIHYCPTHAAVFEYKALAQAQGPVIAALLAALREVVDKCEMAASLAVIKRVALDAIAQVKGDTDA